MIVAAAQLAAETRMRKKKAGKKKKEFGAVERSRLAARQAVGMPRPSRAILNKRHKPPKHKKQIIEQDLDEL